MFYLFQVPQLGTGNAKLDAIAQASALGISLAGVLLATFRKQSKPKKAPARKVSPAPSRGKVVITDEAVDEANARR